MTENINLRREEENLWYRKKLLWIVLVNSFLIWFNVSWQNSEFRHYFLLSNAIFERIVWSISFWLKILDRILNESKFFNCIRTYFRSLESIEIINKCMIMFIFVHFRLNSIESVFYQILCLLQLIKVIDYWCDWRD